MDTGEKNGELESPRVVLTTVADRDQASDLARALVESQLAACVTTIPRVASTYRWKGRIEEEEESLLLVKTTEPCLPGLKSRLLELHPYDVPECLVLDVSDGTGAYLRWLTENTSPSQTES